MARILSGLYIEDPFDLVLISRALADYERNLRHRVGAPMPPHALRMQCEIRALLEGETATRAGNRQRNPRGTGPAGTCELVSVTTAVGILGVTPQAVRKAARDGRLDGMKDGSTWMLTAESVHEMAARNEANR